LKYKFNITERSRRNCVTRYIIYLLVIWPVISDTRPLLVKTHFPRSVSGVLLSFLLA